MTRNEKIAREILSQIKTLDAWAMGDYGAKNLVWIENGLQFKSSGAVKNKGIIKIVLNTNDLYDITFGRIRKNEYKEVNRLDDMFCADLIVALDHLIHGKEFIYV